MLYLARQYSAVLLASVISVAFLCICFLWRQDLAAQVQTVWHTGEDNRTGLDHYAHRLQSADEFWPHFENVFQQKAVTMAEAKAGCSSWSEEDLERIDFQFSDGAGAFIDAHWVSEDRSDDEMAQRRLQWQNFVKNDMIPYERFPREDGRGIVVVGGQGKSIYRIKVLLRQLKRLGSSMSVELHYWGDEMDEARRDSLKELWPRMFFNDISSLHNIYQTEKAGFTTINFHFKLAAIINSRFEEVLLMDSDNFPAIKPEDLFASKTYKEFGSVFWPDIARTRSNNPIWSITNTLCRTDEYEQESGQVLVDKSKFWYHLQLALFFINTKDDNVGYYHNFLLGDKDTFRFAWHALKTKYGSPSRQLSSAGTLTGDYFCGHTFAQYHPDHEDGRVAFLHGGLLKTMPAPVMQWHREANGGIWQAYKAVSQPENPADIEKIRIKIDPQKYMPGKPEGMEGQWCTDMEDVKARPFEELLTGFDEVFAEIGGYWLLENVTSSDSHD